jgi:hypothetical protein
VRQFRAGADGKPPVSVFSLGHFQSSFGTVADTVQGRKALQSAQPGGGLDNQNLLGSLAPLSKGLPEAGALVQMYTAGTACDVTGVLRSSEVRFVCTTQDSLTMLDIKEVSTCQYVVTVAAAASCAHVDATSESQAAVPAVPVHCILASSIPL